MVFLVILGASTFSYGQATDKKVTHDDERLSSDAYAMAYAKCKVETAKYKSDSKPTDQMLLNSYNRVLLDYNKFSVNINVKYKVTEELFEKFTRKIKSAKKQLPTCINYQRTMDSNANNEKAKAEQSQ